MANVSELFVKLNTIAFYANATSVSSSIAGYYPKCLLKPGGYRGEYRFIHCEWLDLKFIPDEPIYSSEQLQVFHWLSLLKDHSYHVTTIRNESLNNASDYLKNLSPLDFQKNHVERMLYDYRKVPYVYCEQTFWREAKESFAKLPEPVRKLILTVIKRVTIESKTDVQKYSSFVTFHELESIDTKIDLDQDEYEVALKELNALHSVY
ncbi:hypothetical protein [uncultured Legionella sp.]|uniref:hypothetical protein n=1 Tax=uncultured Legionella sp. TaxID=210934 RepID=UPI002638D5F5|nr:hypothetical protein [uncultured Legionella sp.]